jgi:serine protease DegQ
LNPANDQPILYLMRKVNMFQHFRLSLLTMVAMASFLALPCLAALPSFGLDGEPMPSLAPLLKKVNPAVVNISTHSIKTVRNPLLEDPFFRRFFQAPEGQVPAQQRRTQSAGSGVIVDASAGTVVTNFHVVDGADEIIVTLSDNRSFTASLVGGDPEVDIAVLQIEASDLVAIDMADSDHLLQGDFVIAIGNPFGLQNTVTSGVVSALGRSGLGGALVNLRGELVGINTAIIAPGGGNVGIGLAIPMNMARHSMEQIVEHGEVRRGQLGVIIQDLTSEMAEAFKLDRQQKGVVIAQVREGSAADQGGVKADDIVTGVDGKLIESSAQLRNAIGSKRIDERVELTLLRDGQKLKLTMRIGERENVARNARDIHPALEGVKLRDDEAREGVLIEAIANGSAAAGSGLRKGDLLVAANRVRIGNMDELIDVASRSDGNMLLRIIRGNTALYLILR